MWEMNKCVGRLKTYLRLVKIVWSRILSQCKSSCMEVVDKRTASEVESFQNPVKFIGASSRLGKFLAMVGCAQTFKNILMSMCSWNEML
mmetsp:Transcript_5189/g.18543  ORF Transcript_5189/g.18543 Transcript_5189/m.18543 type:complete len:89 (+) Transcript_5189:2-268(+)